MPNPHGRNRGYRAHHFVTRREKGHRNRSHNFLTRKRAKDHRIRAHNFVTGMGENVKKRRLNLVLLMSTDPPYRLQQFIRAIYVVITLSITFNIISRVRSTKRSCGSQFSSLIITVYLPRLTTRLEAGLPDEPPLNSKSFFFFSHVVQLTPEQFFQAFRAITRDVGHLGQTNKVYLVM